MDDERDVRSVARSPYEVADAVGFGITSEDLRTWAPCYPLDIHWARVHELDVGTVRRWLDAGISVQDAVSAQQAGVDLDEVQRWVDAGFAPADAALAADVEMGLREAVAWREAGFILPDAALLYQEDWTLEAAIEARWHGLDPYERQPGVAADPQGGDHIDGPKSNGSMD